MEGASALDTTGGFASLEHSKARIYPLEQRFMCSRPIERSAVAQRRGEGGASEDRQTEARSSQLKSIQMLSEELDIIIAGTGIHAVRSAGLGREGAGEWRLVSGFLRTDPWAASCGRSLISTAKR